ncbi:MAG: sulfatase-like hydrolase/transferase [Bacteroidales bacterium]
MKMSIKAAGLLAATVPAMAFAQQKPNVVIIVADDLGWADLGCHGSVIPTPNIDGFFNRGIELGRYYTAPVSSPTRCGLMTGRYPSRFGIRETVIPPWRDYGLDENEVTMADVLGENGYQDRAIVGKWHLGHSRKVYYPLNRGFTHFYGHLNGAVEYFTHQRDGELDWHNDWESCYDKGYSTDLIAGEAVRCVGEYAKNDNPFFLYVAFNAPHSPYEAPEDEIYSLIPKKDFDLLPDKDKKGWTYRAMVSRMDKGVGKILAALEKSGEMDNTIVLFMSDNGGVPNLYPYCSNRPSRGSKFEEWEGGVRTAAAIYWKDGFRHDTHKLEQVVAFVDILPTLADIIDIKKAPVHPYDGVSMLPVLSGKSDSIDRDLYLGVGAAVNNNYKMILAGKNKRLGLTEDFFTDIVSNPREDLSLSGGPASEKDRLRKVIESGDAIVPVTPELPYDYGKKGFVTPFEWKVTKP